MSKDREYANATALAALGGMSMAERRPIKVRELADLIERERAARWDEALEAAAKRADEIAAYHRREEERTGYEDRYAHMRAAEAAEEAAEDIRAMKTRRDP